MEQQSLNKMGSEAIPKLLPKMGLPMVLSMMLQAFYNVVDSYFVSRMPDANGTVNMGEQAVNALTLAFPIQIWMVSVGVGTGVGINALLSRSLGVNNRGKASRIAGNGIFLGICGYGLFLLVGLFGIGAYMGSQTKDPVILGMGGAYLRICTTLSFGLMLYTIYEKLLQASGRTELSMIAQVAGAVTNIVLDPIMIFGLLGVPAMGVRGAAYATVIGQWVSLVLAMVFHYTLNKEIDPAPRYLRPEKTLVADIYKIGIPAAVMQALISVMSYGLNIVFGMVDASVVTAYGIYYKLQQFVYFATLGMNNALIPILGFNYGKKDRSRLVAGVRWGIAYSLILMFIGALCLQVFAHPLVGIFALSPKTELLCIQAIRIATLGYLLAGFNITSEAIFQAFGQGVNSLLISLTRLAIVLLAAYGLALTVSAEMNVWWSMPLSEGCAFIASLLFLRSLFRNKLKSLEPGPALKEEKDALFRGKSVSDH